MNRSFKILVALAFVVACLAQKSAAQTTYTYSGDPFSYVGTSDYYGAPVTGVTGSFTVTNALSADTTYTLTPDTIGGAIIGYSFTDGRYTDDLGNFTDSNSAYFYPNSGDPVFEVTTGDTGNIVSWDLNLLGTDAWLYTLNGTLDNNVVSDGTLADPSQAYDAYNYNTPGTWTEVTVPDETATLPLVVLALGGLVLARRRKAASHRLVSPTN